MTYLVCFYECLVVAWGDLMLCLQWSEVWIFRSTRRGASGSRRPAYDMLCVLLGQLADVVERSAKSIKHVRYAVHRRCA